MSSGLPEATFSLIRSASGKSLTFTGPSAFAESGKSAAATTIRAAIFILFLPLLSLKPTPHADRRVDHLSMPTAITMTRPIMNS